MADEIPDEPIEMRAVYDRGGDVILNIGEGRWEIGGWCGDWRAAWRAFGPLRFALPGPVVGAGRRLLIEQGRRQAVDAILAHAEQHAPEPSPLRRHLHIAARVAAGPATMQAIADALATGNYLACRLNDEGQPYAGKGDTNG